MESTNASIKSTSDLTQKPKGITTIQKVHHPILLSITDNVFLPGQPELNAPNDAYEPVQIPKQNILEESLRREV